ncbi:MAG: hypothetical protein AB7F95_14425 [Burkholderiales bacterium]
MGLPFDLPLDESAFCLSRRHLRNAQIQTHPAACGRSGGMSKCRLARRFIARGGVPGNNRCPC